MSAHAKSTNITIPVIIDISKTASSGLRPPAVATDKRNPYHIGGHVGRGAFGLGSATDF